MFSSRLLASRASFLSRCVRSRTGKRARLFLHRFFLFRREFFVNFARPPARTPQRKCNNDCHGGVIDGDRHPRDREKERKRLTRCRSATPEMRERPPLLSAGRHRMFSLRALGAVFQKEPSVRAGPETCALEPLGRTRDDVVGPVDFRTSARARAPDS